MDTREIDPAVYCGTYGKYSSGSIAGGWLNIEDYADKEDFYNACKKLHKDEADPEFMFQDWEGIPSAFISECDVDESLWLWLALDHGNKQEIAAIIDNDITISLEDAINADYIVYDDRDDLFWQWLESMNIPDELSRFIDGEKVLREIETEATILDLEDGRILQLLN
jgi:antirestriction protein